ncbi:MAG TPA: hypothetical protein DEH02_19100 [Bacteroidales bacterium]|nr:hypothetical protein [Bacteroidales bacterium]
MMKTVNITIPDNEFLKLGIDKTNLTFEEFYKKISIMIARDAIIRCRQIAKKTGLSDMTEKDIEKEINESRRNA